MTQERLYPIESRSNESIERLLEDRDSKLDELREQLNATHESLRLATEQLAQEQGLNRRLINDAPPRYPFEPYEERERLRNLLRRVMRAIGPPVDEQLRQTAFAEAREELGKP